MGRPWVSIKTCWILGKLGPLGRMDGCRFTTFCWEIDPHRKLIHWHIMTTGTAVLHFRNRFLLHAFLSLGRESFGTTPLILCRKLLSAQDVLMPFGIYCHAACL